MINGIVRHTFNDNDPKYGERLCNQMQQKVHDDKHAVRSLGVGEKKGEPITQNRSFVIPHMHSWPGSANSHFTEAK